MGSELNVSPIALSSFCSVRLRLPYSGSLGPRFPTFPACLLGRPSVLCSAKTARSPSRNAPFVTSRCDTLLTPPGFVCPVLLGSLRGEVASAPAPGLFSIRQTSFPVYPQGDNWLSQVPVLPIGACPALGPRWCFRHSPSRAASCCLPSSVTGSAFPPFRTWLSLLDHNILHFGALSHGLLPRYTRPRTHHC